MHPKTEAIEDAIRVTSNIYGAAWLLGISGFCLLRLCAERGIKTKGTIS